MEERAMKRKLRVFISGPISKGNLAANLNQATAAFVALAKAGLAPLCPHWSAYSKPCAPGLSDGECVCIGTRMGNGEMVHADWMNVDLPWVAVSDAVLRLPGESTGADREVEHARSLGVPVYYSLREVIDALAVADVA